MDWNLPTPLLQQFLPRCRGSGAENVPCPSLLQREERGDSRLLLLPEPPAPAATALATGQRSLRSPVRLASPCSRQLESSAGENTISIIGTVQLYQPSWQRGNIFCLNPHRGQIVSSCSSLPSIPWERAKGHILQSSLTETRRRGTPRAGQQWCTGPSSRGVPPGHPHYHPHCMHVDDLGEFFLLRFSRQGWLVALEWAHLEERCSLFLDESIVKGV